MTVTPIRKRTAAALNARHAATAASLDRARAALQQMKHEHAKITVAAVARRALLTELKWTSAHVNGEVAVSGVTVTARDGRW